MRTTIAASFFRISIPFQTLDQSLQLFALDIMYCFMTQLKLISALQGDFHCNFQLAEFLAAEIEYCKI